MAQLRPMLEIAFDAIIETDSRGVIISWSSTAEKAFAEAAGWAARTSVSPGSPSPLLVKQ